ncbi:MAG: phosphoribosylglycinamide formyltransferase [Prevotellaceae bacterium]|jgi:phosphoribosylglycinamide formyltransferase-1|nr:phosphoribosylglycinamide formyltransferase [Prevotellaceae bacterium]
MSNIAVLASGSGSNAQRIFEHFSGIFDANVKILMTNNKNAGVIDRAKRLNLPVKVFDRKDFFASDHVKDFLLQENIDWIVLAGFLWLVPKNLTDSFPNRIVNIHPALLPKYGGKGMYGMHVHEAVIAAGDTESGITIHYVNEEYDSGDIIFQAKTAIDATDTPESLAGKIHQLEYEYFPQILEKLIVGEKG